MSTHEHSLTRFLGYLVERDFVVDMASTWLNDINDDPSLRFHLDIDDDHHSYLVDAAADLPVDALNDVNDTGMHREGNDEGVHTTFFGS